MPIYLCQSGTGHAEPWRQGLQVYAAPFSSHDDNNTNAGSSSTRNNHEEDNGGTAIRRVRHAEVILVDDICMAHGKYWLRLRWPGKRGGFAGYISVQDITKSSATVAGAMTKPSAVMANVMPSASSQEDEENEEEEEEEEEDFGESKDVDAGIIGTDNQALQTQQQPAAGALRMILDDPGVGLADDNNVLLKDGSNSSTDPSTEREGSTPAVSCIRTGLQFLSSPEMRLMPMYEDGLSPQVAIMANINAEPAFCRICREGLHDDADDEQPTPAADDEGDDANANNSNARIRRSTNRNNRASDTFSSRQSSANMDDAEEELDDALLASGNVDFSDTIGGSMDEDGEKEEQQSIQLAATVAEKGPVSPHPTYSPNPHALENPLLAPCECSGSMAFVHYLCVEQWRCRSRHPEAQNGLSCETCGSAYSLPPPASRPNVQAMEQAEDWLDAMPPHVMQALRQPHILWQIGAAVVRRRWLRPLAPVVMSPIVALYCRARRLLKKRGVARRRWACSLCRRRARWKCVRCLRSYYCSRQCQNVSWHIVHKHVCYKPARLWWSTVVYGCLCLLAFPGILRDPLMHDLGLFILPLSFVVIGIIAGGIATVLKKSFAVDLRGRMLELTVVLGTLWLSAVSWGLVRGFFGQEDSCQGSLGRRVLVVEGKVSSTSLVLNFLHRVILIPAEAYYLFWDRLVLSSTTPWLVKLLCIPRVEESGANSIGCFEYLPYASSNFFIAPSVTEEPDEADLLAPSKCAADLQMVFYLYMCAVFAYAGSALNKYRERRQRRLQQQLNPRIRHDRHVPRPHQD